MYSAREPLYLKTQAGRAATFPGCTLNTPMPAVHVVDCLEEQASLRTLPGPSNPQRMIVMDRLHYCYFPRLHCSLRSWPLRCLTRVRLRPRKKLHQYFWASFRRSVYRPNFDKMCLCHFTRSTPRRDNQVGHWLLFHSW
jgi:hypothetical protein